MYEVEMYWVSSGCYPERNAGVDVRTSSVVGSKRCMRPASGEKQKKHPMPESRSQGKYQMFRSHSRLRDI
jgi:hypothetical protein